MKGIYNLVRPVELRYRWLRYANQLMIWERMPTAARRALAEPHLLYHANGALRG